MHHLCFVLLISACSLFAQDQPADASTWMRRGTQEFKSARYSDAVDDFQKAVQLDPSNVKAHLFLATSYFVQYIPGAQNPDNLAIADKARAEYEQVLKLDADNEPAIQYLASLEYSEASGGTDLGEKNRHLDNARSWYLRLLAAEPQNKEILYTLGVIDWMQWFPKWKAAVEQSGISTQDERPIPSASIRAALKGSAHLVDDGMANLRKAIDLDAQYTDALMYMNLLLRERASLADTADEYKSDIAVADHWLGKYMEAKKAKGADDAPSEPAPQAPEAANETTSPKPRTPSRIRVGGNVQAANLIRKVVPVYPADAKNAGIQGTVRFQVIIGKYGQVQDVQLVSGDPALVQAAKDAVQQWVYKPTLLNGEPVEVVTTVDVNFTLH